MEMKFQRLRERAEWKSAHTVDSGALFVMTSGMMRMPALCAED